MVGFSQLRFMMGYLATPRHQIGFCHSTNYSNLLSGPRRNCISPIVPRNSFRRSRSCWRLELHQVEENAKSLLKSIQEVVCYTCIDARAKTVLVSSRKKETVESKSQWSHSTKNVNFVMLQVTATVERAMSVLEKEGFMWKLSNDTMLRPSGFHLNAESARLKDTFLKAWLCQRFNWPCWKSIWILPHTHR